MICAIFFFEGRDFSNQIVELLLSSTYFPRCSALLKRISPLRLLRILSSLHLLIIWCKVNWQAELLSKPFDSSKIVICFKQRRTESVDTTQLVYELYRWEYGIKNDPVAALMHSAYQTWLPRLLE